MTLRTNARIAGVTFLLYIVVGIASMMLFAQASRGSTPAAKLASIAQNAATVRTTVLFTLLTGFIAIALAAALYALTRDEDRDLALLALCFRMVEGVMGAVASVRTLGLISTATAVTAGASDAAAATALGTMLLKTDGSTATVAAICFAAGSTIYCYLFLRARTIPVALAWLGIAASLLLVVVLPAQVAGFMTGAGFSIWMPMLVFEVALALWLIVKGVAVPVTQQSNA